MTPEIFKKIIVFSLVFNIAGAGVAFAQEPDVETKLQETRESIDELIEAKDENSPFDTSLRVKTFKKVVDLALTETKDLKISLIALEMENEQLKAWREEIIENLNETINHYEEKLNQVSESENSFTLEGIQETAAEFKAWREENYTPLQRQIHDFLLIKKENKAIQISNRRVGKINNDLEILKQAGFKELEKISTMFKEAENIIKNAEKENEEALELFIENYASKASSTPSNASATATSTDIATSTSTKVTSTAQTFSTQSTSTAELKDSPEEKQDKSIRGLVSSSWKKIRSAYQIFIEMSGFVRKSLE